MAKIIGLDLGSKTCGIAISDALQMIARALTTVRFESDDYEACLQEVLKISVSYTHLTLPTNREV